MSSRVSEFKDHLQATLARRSGPSCWRGTYVPQPVRRVEIPKPDGGVRTLGIPTVVDRLIQQALHQVLQPMFEPAFSEASYGFRPGQKRASGGAQAAEYVAQGKRWVVDMDLEKFFDRVNHDLLMGKLATRIDDQRVLTLIRRYLEAGMMAGRAGAVRAWKARRKAGRSRRCCPTSCSPSWTGNWNDAATRSAATRTTATSMWAANRRASGCWQVSPGFLAERLKLKVNAAKSAVERAVAAEVSGLQHHVAPDSRSCALPRRASSDSSSACASTAARGARAQSGPRIENLNPLLRGWAAYFKLTQTRQALESFDGWIRRKLRCLLWRQWKRVHTRPATLMQARFDGRAGMAVGHQPAWPVVQRRRLSHERGLPQILVRPPWGWCRCSIPCSASSALPEPPYAEP